MALIYGGWFYEHNLRNDITRHTRTDASFVDYDYDNLGQLTDAVGSGGQSVELLAYGYDTGWNMTGNGATGYTMNDRNQVTSATDGTSFWYDAHGNLLGRDNWNQQYGLLYSYDAENRLTRVEEDTYYIPYYAIRSDFVYDGLSRLRIRRDYYYDSWSAQWYLNTEVRYVYDGRRVIQERSSANTPTVTYTRGSDLSGSLEGAGGIGGMLARSHGYSGSTGGWSTHNYYHADAGGNITCLINAGQSITASYRYDPFGRTLFQSGTMASANVYRFSSKEVHGFTGMYYYGFRFYDPGLQRWINRDPIGERYDKNHYRFVNNNPFVFIDPNGAWGVCFGDWCVGRGDPTLAFNQDSWTDMGQGAYATLDGANPFGDPLANRGYYDPCDRDMMVGQLAGAIAREAAITAIGGHIAKGAAGAANWAKVPLPLKGYAARAWPMVALKNSTSPGVYAVASGLNTGVNVASIHDLWDNASSVTPLPSPPPLFGGGSCP